MLAHSDSCSRIPVLPPRGERLSRQRIAPGLSTNGASTLSSVSLRPRTRRRGEPGDLFRLPALG